MELAPCCKISTPREKLSTGKRSSPRDRYNKANAAFAGPCAVVQSQLPGGCSAGFRGPAVKLARLLPPKWPASLRTSAAIRRECPSRCLAEVPLLPTSSRSGAPCAESSAARAGTSGATRASLPGCPGNSDAPGGSFGARLAEARSSFSPLVI